MLDQNAGRRSRATLIRMLASLSPEISREIREAERYARRIRALADKMGAQTRYAKKPKPRGVIPPTLARKASRR